MAWRCYIQDGKVHVSRNGSPMNGSEIEAALNAGEQAKAELAEARAEVERLKAELESTEALHEMAGADAIKIVKADAKAEADARVQAVIDELDATLASAGYLREGELRGQILPAVRAKHAGSSAAHCTEAADARVQAVIDRLRQYRNDHEPPWYGWGTLDDILAKLSPKPPEPEFVWDARKDFRGNTTWWLQGQKLEQVYHNDCVSWLHYDDDGRERSWATLAEAKAAVEAKLREANRG